MYLVSGPPQIYSPQTKRHRDQIRSHTSSLVSAASYETAEENQVERNLLDQKCWVTGWAWNFFSNTMFT
jgi:hypothetical protein